MCAGARVARGLHYYWPATGADNEHRVRAFVDAETVEGFLRDHLPRSRIDSALPALSSGGPVRCSGSCFSPEERGRSGVASGQFTCPAFWTPLISNASENISIVTGCLHSPVQIFDARDDCFPAFEPEPGLPIAQWAGSATLPGWPATTRHRSTADEVGFRRRDGHPTTRASSPSPGCPSRPPGRCCAAGRSAACSCRGSRRT